MKYTYFDLIYVLSMYTCNRWQQAHLDKAVVAAGYKELPRRLNVEGVHLLFAPFDDSDGGAVIRVPVRDLFVLWFGSFHPRASYDMMYCMFQFLRTHNNINKKTVKLRSRKYKNYTSKQQLADKPDSSVSILQHVYRSHA